MTPSGYPGVLLDCPPSSTLTVNWSQIGPGMVPTASRAGGQRGQGPGGPQGLPPTPTPFTPYLEQTEVPRG